MSLEGTQGHFKYPYKLIIKWFVYIILFSCTVVQFSELNFTSGL